MATTHIHAIRSTVSASIEYAMRDKVEADVNKNISQSVNYAVNDKTGEVTYFTLSSFHRCVGNPTKEFERLAWEFGYKELLNGNSKTKDGGPILAWHLIQSFDGEEVTPQQANEIGMRLVEELLPNHPAVISTHTNTENMHNHIVFCAWNFDGKKYNLDHDAYQKIRNVSDRLCEEYGLAVLDHTKNVNLVAWKDDEGVTHYFEPTDRKIKLIEEREAGIAAPEDVNSYRNTMAYDVKYKKEQSNIATVKMAIDQALPYATSYEHLLSMLREAGFEIKAKKKNGEWLKHITFTPIGAERGVRDTSIDKEGGFYARENLTKIIEDNNEGRREAQRSFRLVEEKTPPYFAEYVYGEMDIKQLDEDYRTERYEDQFESGFRVVQRSEAEKSMVKDIKRDDADIGLHYDSAALDSIIRNQQATASHYQRRRGELSPDYKARVERQIQEKLDELRFIEQKNIYSVGQLRDQTKSLWHQYNLSKEKLAQVDRSIEQYDEALTASERLAEVNNRIEEKKGDTVYMMEQYSDDLSSMRKYAALIDRFKLHTPEGMAAMRERVEKMKANRGELESKMNAFRSNLTMYDRCLRSLERIEREDRERAVIAVIPEQKETTRNRSVSKEVFEDKKKGTKDDRSDN